MEKFPRHLDVDACVLWRGKINCATKGICFQNILFDWEIIIIDDCSAGEMLKLVQE